MEVESPSKDVVPAPSSTQNNQSNSSAVQSWLSGSTISIIIQIVGLACVIAWFYRKNSQLTQQITDLSSRLEEAESAIERHENVLKKVMTLLGNRQKSAAQSVSQPAAQSTSQSVAQSFSQPVAPVVTAPLPPVQPAPRQVVQQVAQQEQQASFPQGFSLSSIIDTALGAAFPGAMSGTMGGALDQPMIAPSIVELPTIQELDAELKSEFGELNE